MSLEVQRTTIEDDLIKDDISHLYALDSGVTIDVDAHIFHSKEKSDASRAVIFLPGWAMDSKTKSIERLCEQFSEEAKADTYAISTRSKERGQKGADADFIYEEARAIKRFIQQRGLKNVTLAGHSMGGDKAIDLATLLQDDPEISLNGVVLIDAVGLYDQGRFELARKFTQNSLGFTPYSIGKQIPEPGKDGGLSGSAKRIGPAIQAGWDVGAGIVSEVMNSKIEYWSRFKSEVTEMAAQNSRTKELRVPVIVVSGIDDSVSDPERIIPENELGPLRKSLGEVKRPDATDSNPARDTTFAAREAYLHEHLFKNSPYVRMLTPKKFGGHWTPS